MLMDLQTRLQQTIVNETMFIEQLNVLTKDEGGIQSKNIAISGPKESFFINLSEQYIENMKFLKKIDYRLSYLAEHERKRKRAVMAFHVERLKMIRDDTSYNMALQSLMKTLKANGTINNVTPETDVDIKKAFQEALDDLKEPKAFANRLRQHEVTILVDYKNHQTDG